PDVAGRADLAVRRAVRIGEVERVVDVDRAVVAGRRRDAGKAARPAVQLSAVAARLVRILALPGGHEADAVRPAAVVEAGGLDRLAAAAAELGREFHIKKRVPSGGAREADLEEAPLLDRRARS